MNVRSMLRWGNDGRPIPRHCEAQGCAKATRSGKPYCPVHVALHPYVQSLLTEIDQREREVEKVARRGTRAVDCEGPTVQDIVTYLQVHGDRTVPGLAREMNIDCATLEAFVKALRRRGLVETEVNRRGATVVALTQAMTKQQSAAAPQPIAPNAQENAA
mgnify:FL=1